MIAYLVRHGEAQNNVQSLFPDDEHSAYRLTEVGRAQATAAGMWLRKVKPTLIITSPVTRARETAELISAATGAPVRAEERLREARLGLLAGKNYEEFAKADPNWYTDYFDEASKYGIEKFMSIRQRMISALGENWGPGPIVVVSHLEPIRSVVSLALGITGPSVRKVRIFNGSITAVEICPASDPQLISLNCVPTP
ncbi:MAG: histidine phosphatase family protein [Thermoprotei archaeon]|nr:histidine phosphatase family protein [TACK group archaeon]